AYMHDVSLLAKFYHAQSSSTTLSSVTSDDLQNFLHQIAQLGMSSTSQARITSGIRSFFRYLTLEKIIDKNPAELLETPKLKRALPEVLSYFEIENMIQSLDLSKPEGVRNKAILETIYSCGLRVSELISLKISGIYR